MKKLKDILSGFDYEVTHGDCDVPVKGLHFDSRLVTGGDVFFAIPGVLVDGHDYIQGAIDKGCRCVVLEKLGDYTQEDMTFVLVKDGSIALAAMASAFFDHPSRKIDLVGITGTNGKTTTATLLHDLYSSIGHKCGLISTVTNKVSDKSIKATHTTPNPVSLNSLLNEMVNEGCTHCFMEVSSHAVVQNRIHGIQFKGGVFTNISHDHLDYHKTFDAYIKAKKKFFDDLPGDSFALVNIDDKNGSVMQQNTSGRKYTFALKTPADFKAKIIENEISGLIMNMDGMEFYSRLIGQFNAYNLLTVFATATLLGEDKLTILSALSNLSSVDGRFQYVKGQKGPTAIIDYAHTPDALENVLSTINSIKKKNSKLYTVVGCGGDRDVSKRPIMASIAARLSDQLILTSDNPRNENPEVILEDMKKGLDKVERDMTLSISDRREAIKLAIKLASSLDIVLLAGKGHEKYQEVKGVRYDFDDYQIASEFLNQIEN
ncbi:UDP-N-acetylmuramoyl-L-alanyl-D-glutamate--2,6-diaminopimelate ligase [Crocinitomicaceae bacterium]|jgi:UDP-N-acetylmuramoyl-L-alanyl-D-glutamate--2,6-diaminopimelate ligase|nr:UDP-N-acetylmuramoyl-L-alanyl-D-glutamate--2,6-diaminopimelate ligase [Crocinitomicaceae bacterium]